MNDFLTVLLSQKAKAAEAEIAALGEKLDKLTVENDRLKREGSNLRAQLFFLEDGTRQAVDKETARHMIVNDIGQHFCPRCHACVYEPAGISTYWQRCRYKSKEPPTYCPRCGQHLTK